MVGAASKVGAYEAERSGSATSHTRPTSAAAIAAAHSGRNGLRHAPIIASAAFMNGSVPDRNRSSGGADPAAERSASLSAERISRTIMRRSATPAAIVAVRRPMPGQALVPDHHRNGSSSGSEAISSTAHEHVAPIATAAIHRAAIRGTSPRISSFDPPEYEYRVGLSARLTTPRKVVPTTASPTQ